MVPLSLFDNDDLSVHQLTLHNCFSFLSTVRRYSKKVQLASKNTESSTDNLFLLEVTNNAASSTLRSFPDASPLRTVSPSQRLNNFWIGMLLGSMEDGQGTIGEKEGKDREPNGRGVDHDNRHFKPGSPSSDPPK